MELNKIQTNNSLSNKDDLRNETTQSTQKQKGKYIKIIIAFIVFIIICSILILLIYFLLINKQKGEETDSNIQSNANTTQKSDEDEDANQPCSYNGKIYKELESFDAADGCNRCFCQDGLVSCTEIECKTDNEHNNQNNNCKYNDIEIKHNDTYKIEDYCMTCYCYNGVLTYDQYICINGEYKYKEEQILKTISVKDKSLKEVFKAAEDIIGYDLFYPADGNYTVINDTIYIGSYNETALWEKFIGIHLLDENNKEIVISAGLNIYQGGVTGENSDWEVNTNVGKFKANDLYEPFALLDIESDEYQFMISFEEDYTRDQVNTYLNILKQVD